MNKLINVALNMSHMSVPQKIVFARQVTDALANNPSVFQNPFPTLTAVNSAINDLEIAMQDASDGGKSKTALMHDKEHTVYKLMKALAHYVEMVANGDEQVVHLATFSLKKVGIKHKPDFEVFLPDDLGAVGLRCKARKKALYKWQYSPDPIDPDSWILGNTTDVSSSFIGSLQSGIKYWFRVVLVTAVGEHALPAKCILTL